ncbi:hypothetical protein FRC04_000875 [Tulasnella sp. 424]|nr:hypothetical protein FRC04_000875 [Tulasnella sp. 424]KAG8975389.1 hypothetical protein FRC05_005719 [Tulasnella sp. 425]
MVEYIKTLEEFKRITAGDKPVVIDFTASWCPPCRMIGPVFEALSKEEELASKVEFYKVDVDDARDVAQECGIRAMPTFKVYKSEAEVEMIQGANPPALKALVRKYAGLEPEEEEEEEEDEEDEE